MRVVETKVFKFPELDDAAKEKAREWARNIGDLYGWSNESLASIKAFCDRFSVKLSDWAVGPFMPYEYKIEAENHHFRGLKLKDFRRDEMPTGYCLDGTLYETFHDEFKRTGDAKQAFESAVEAGFIEWRKDWEDAYSDEQIDDFVTANEYEFEEDGTRFKG